jgi:chromosome partitioning protein
MIVSVANSKGGVGKSTLAVHAAVWLHERGVRVAAVDADAQGSLSDWLPGAAQGLRIERCETAEELAERVPRLTSVYDVIVADGPAGLGRETVALAGVSDTVLLPIGPSMMDVRASYRTARLLYGVRMRRKDDRPAVLTVLNRVQPRTRLTQVALAAVQKYGFPVAHAALHLRQAYAEACGLRTVVWRMGARARDAAAEITALLEQIFAAWAVKQRDAADVVRRPVQLVPPSDGGRSTGPVASGTRRSRSISAVLRSMFPDELV